jgi:GNAT superfamily N-acetyltransferase
MLGVPIVGDIDRPERRTLVDENGLSVARYLHAERDGRAIADLLELDVPVARALPYITRELRGMRIAGSEELGRALVAAGGRLYRHSHAYTHDLVALPALDTTHELTPVDRPASELLPVYLAAFGSGHPDRMEPDEAARHLEGIVAGKLGGLLAGSGLAIEDDRVVAAILIGTITDAPMPFGGPWIMEVFSTRRGAGRALLRRALHRTEGSLGLAVTEGNPAIAIYESLGFRRTFTAYTVDL